MLKEKIEVEMTTKLKGFLVVLSVIAAGHSAPQNDFFQDLPVDFDPYQVRYVILF